MNINPDYAEAQNNLGNLLSHEAGKTRLKNIYTGLAIKTGLHRSTITLCDILLKTGRFQEAIENYQQVLR